MTSEELFKAGHLREALAEQTVKVKKSPVDTDARHMLFVLLCFSGEVERAGTQLEVLAKQDDQIRQGALVYHSLLASEWERRSVYEGKAEPTLPPDPPAYAALRVQALQCLARGDVASAEARVTEAAEQSASLKGTMDGAAFDGVRDDDDLLGTIFEVFAGGRYLWIPMENVRSLEFTAPATALDTLWRPVKLEDVDGSMADVHMPVLYASSYDHEDDAVRLGRSTHWREQGELYTGLGQHAVTSYRGGEPVESSLLDLVRIDFDAAS
jgi:type VI secretion system protein ImpE